MCLFVGLNGGRPVHPVIIHWRHLPLHETRKRQLEKGDTTSGLGETREAANGMLGF
jgi:hypothetical protein